MSTPLSEVMEQKQNQHRESLKALKPKASKNLNSVKALMLTMKTKLGDSTDDNDNFYYKVAWHLSEAQIMNIIERSQNASKPMRYFMAAAAREL